MAKIAPSPILSDMAGAYQGVVVANGRTGLVIRRAARYKRAQSSAQKDAAKRMKTIAALWPEMDPAKAEAWNAYAETVTRRNTLTGQTYSPTGFNVFTGLACKVLQVDPTAEIPTTPPTGVFIGDSLTLSAQGQTGAILFSADGPNDDGTTTELLIEMLPNMNRKPTGRLQNAAFHAFAPGSLTAAVPLGPGWYVTGYRYVETATGRTSHTLLLGKVQVV